MMRQKIFLGLLLTAVIILSSCSYLIPDHPTKSKDQFRADQIECEKVAQSFFKEFGGLNEPDTHMNISIHVRNCLKTKGWTY